MLITKENSALLVIDVQTKLLGPIFESEMLVNNCSWLIRLAQLLDVPVLATEQYPQGVGHTVDELRQLLDENKIIAKTIFSCADVPECMTAINALEKEQIILCGMEAHVCVMQTAIDLKNLGKKVYVAADAISSRNPRDRDLAISRMSNLGIEIISCEMAGFEWVRRSDMPHFKTFSKEFLR